MKQLSSPVGGVAGPGKTHLETFDLRMPHEVIPGSVASGRRGKLSRKDRRPGRRTINTGGVGVDEINAARGEPVQVRGQGLRRRPVTPDPVVHVVDGEEEDVRSPVLLPEDQAGTYSDENKDAAFHVALVLQTFLEHINLLPLLSSLIL